VHVARRSSLQELQRESLSAKNRKISCDGFSLILLNVHRITAGSAMGELVSKELKDTLRRLFSNPAERAPYYVAFSGLPAQQQEELLSLDDAEFRAVLDLLLQPTPVVGTAQCNSAPADIYYS
jgi:hypothetical protein